MLLNVILAVIVIILVAVAGLYLVLEMLGKGAEAEQLREGMMFNHLMS